MSYFQKMTGAVIVAIFIGGPIAAILSVDNKTVVGVGIGTLTFMILSVLPSRKQ